MTNHPATPRMRIVMIVSLGLAFLILVRFALIMLPANRGNAAPVRTPILAERGSIVDRNGRIIALQTRLWSVTAWRPGIDDSVETGRILGEILDADPHEISRMLSGKNPSRFLYIRRQATPTQSDKIRSLIEQGLLPGIGLQEELGRHYPMKELAAPLIGHVGTDNTGLDGIEYAFNRVLAPGRMSTDIDRIYGHTVQLTLDMNVQYLVERIADSAWEKHLPDSLIILVMDAQTGEILSWVSRPSYDPNTFTESTWEHRVNRPLAIAYEPGSVFKVFTWSTFLDIGNVQLGNVFDTQGGYEPEIFVKYRIPPITDITDYGVMNVSDALIYSSNVAAAQASESVSSADFYKNLKNFGFGSPTGLPVSGETHGLLNPIAGWSARSKPTIAIGQEIGVSAVQIAAAATTLANGGILLQPRIVSKVLAADGSMVKEYPRTPVREVISPKTAKTMLNLMEQTVSSTNGTSHRAAVPGLRISAKSGTAQITDPETGRYSTDRFLSSVLGIFPTDNPQLIVYVVLENPKGTSIYGAQTAAPVLGDIAQSLAPLFGIPLAGNTVIDHSGKVKIENPIPLPLEQVLPDFTGYSKRMILPYLNRDDIQWSIDGDGWVVFQFPPAGTPIEDGMSVYLELH